MEKDSLELLYASIDTRLQQLREGQTELVRQVTQIAEHQKETNGDVANIMAELGGAPDWRSRGTRETMREHLHRIDNDKAATDLTNRLIVSASEREHVIHSRTWSVRQKVALFIIALVTVTLSILQSANVIH